MTLQSFPNIPLVLSEAIGIDSIQYFRKKKAKNMRLPLTIKLYNNSCNELHHNVRVPVSMFDLRQVETGALT